MLTYSDVCSANLEYAANLSWRERDELETKVMKQDMLMYADVCGAQERGTSWRRKVIKQDAG